MSAYQTGIVTGRSVRRISTAWRPSRLTTFIALVVGGGALVFALAVLRLLTDPAHVPLAFIAAAFVLGVLRLDAYGDWVSLSLIPIIAAGYFYGPAGGTLAGVAGALGASVRARKRSRKMLFNFALFALFGGAAAAAGTPAAQGGQSLAALIGYGLVAAVALYVINACLLCTAIALDIAGNPLAIWHERFRWMLPQTLLMGQMAVGLAVAYRALGAYELAVFAMPVLAMQLAVRQYLAHTARSVEDLRQKNTDLLRLTSSLKLANEAVNDAYRGTLEALAVALDTRDNEVHGHSTRVSLYSQAVAEELGIPAGSVEWEAITRGALLHDVGKIGVPDAVLRKPGSLSEPEWMEMRRHAEYGYNILKDVAFLKPAALLVRAHHERFDGSGYPRGLRGEQIPIGARIFAVVDTFDAITSDRPYRPAAPPEAAVAEIRRCASTQFDPAVVTAFDCVWPRLWSQREAGGELVA